MQLCCRCPLAGKLVRAAARFVVRDIARSGPCFTRSSKNTARRWCLIWWHRAGHRRLRRAQVLGRLSEDIAAAIMGLVEDSAHHPGEKP
jgi:hypothetical protein